MVAVNATYMGASDLVTSSTKYIMESIWKKHHKIGHIYIKNLNRNDRDTVKQFSGGIPSGLFILSTETISLITKIGCSNTFCVFKQYFVTGSLMELMNCPDLKGISDSCKDTHKVIF